MNRQSELAGLEVAVIGMSGKFPGASDLEQFWENLKTGKESIRFFTEEELKAPDVNRTLTESPAFVPCKGGMLEEKDLFDAGFFRYSSDEAELLSPQTRLFHECVWNALEDAGFNARNHDAPIGLYAGASSGFNWEIMSKLFADKFNVSGFISTILSGREFLCSQTSYKLNLKGPSVNIQTACSTSLTAIHTACRALYTGECQVAVAGGVSLSLDGNGYLYEEGMIASKDGHVRAFDKDASGVVNGEGVGVVVLKLLKRALKDGDNIHAVIRGSYANNDGDDKVGYTAPGVDGQYRAIASALKMASLPVDSIGYVETHGTATRLGDVTEIEALKKAFATAKRNYCALGSVKTNIGHLDAAAGIAGFLKTVLALKYQAIPPSLHFKEANPAIDFVNSPFFVNAQLREWQATEFPRRAGISSFGIGGTNVHVVVEEFTDDQKQRPGKEDQLLILSAKTEKALDAMTQNLAAFLTKNPDLPLADVAWTLMKGRQPFNYRRKLLCSSVEEAAAVLSDPSNRKIASDRVLGDQKRVVFLLSGMGSQYFGMCRDLYLCEPVFREATDACFGIIRQLSGLDLKTILFDEPLATAAEYHRMDIGQYMIFVVEYALAVFLRSLGIQPRAMIGYSLGEYVAACLAGVFPLEDALAIIHKRAVVINELPAGAMLSVPMTAEEIKPHLNDSVHLAIDNGPSCVLAGSEETITALEEAFRNQRVMAFRMAATKAMHTPLMNPAKEAFAAFVATITLNKPTIPFISNISGTWISDTQATNPEYWADHMCQTVAFSEGLDKLIQGKDQIFIEIGPGTDISNLVNRQLEQAGVTERSINLVRPEANKVNDYKYFLNRLGQLWLRGLQVNWIPLFANEERRKVALPTYPFERIRFDKLPAMYQSGNLPFLTNAVLEQKDWFYLPAWKRAATLSFQPKPSETLGNILLLASSENAAVEAFCNSALAEQVKVVTHGFDFQQSENDRFILDLSNQQHYEQLFRVLQSENWLPDRIVCLTGLTPSEEAISPEILIQNGYYSLLGMAQSLATTNLDTVLPIDVIANGLAEINGTEILLPEKAVLLGPVKVIPQELGQLACRLIDIEATGDYWNNLPEMLIGLNRELPAEPVVAVRGKFAWTPDFCRRDVQTIDAGNQPRLRQNGTYLLTGGLGGIALEIAHFLAKNYAATIVLLARTPLPDREQWDRLLQENNPAEDLTAERIHRIREIEKAGGKACIIEADLSDEEQVMVAVAKAGALFGPIHGVLHTATTPDGALIAVRDKKASDALFATKIFGTRFLEKALVNEQPDFIMLFSSLSSVLGGFGQVGYTSANAYLDAYAQQLARTKDCFAVAVNWDRWRGTGIARIGEKRHFELAQEELAGGMRIDEALQCFEQILRLPDSVSQVAISQMDLWKEYLNSTQGKAFEIDEQNLVDTVDETERIQRPDLSTDYEAPANETETQLTAIWTAFFGIKEIGVNDNFFELGGDSLKGMVLLKRVRKELNIEFSIKELFLNPTIRGLSDETIKLKQLLEKKKRSSSITI